MRCSKLILIYGIFYMFSCILIMRENMILDAVKQENRRIEYAISVAAEAAALTLKNSVYEDGAEIIAEKTFEYIFKAAYEFSVPDGENINEFESKSGSGNKSGNALSEIIIGDEYGTRVKGEQLKELKEGEEIKICFVLNDIFYNAYGRRVAFKKTAEYTVTLDSENSIK